MSLVKLEITKNIAEININRNEKKNALNTQLLTEGIKILNQINQDRSIDILILKTKGNIFCAGLDLKELKAFKSKNRSENHFHANYLQEFLKKINDLKIMTVLKLQGSAFGAGVGLISVFDIVYSVFDIKIQLPEINLGLPPTIIMPFLIKKMGIQNYKSFIFAHCGSISSQIAHKLNLIDIISNKNEFEETFKKNINSINNTKTLRSFLVIKNQLNKFYTAGYNYEDIFKETLNVHIKFRKDMTINI